MTQTCLFLDTNMYLLDENSMLAFSCMAGYKGTPNAQVSLRISRQPRQQKIHIFASYNPSFSQPMTLKTETLQLNIYCGIHFYHIIYFLII